MRKSEQQSTLLRMALVLGCMALLFTWAVLAAVGLAVLLGPVYRALGS